jgi:hypothetical protein
VIAEELIPPSHMAVWDAAAEKANRRATSGVTLLVLAALAVAVSIFLPSTPASEAWTMIGPEGHLRLSWAGMWHVAASRPIPLFLVLLWLWRWASVALFTLTMARLPLRLRMGHPDQVGGLAVVGDLATGGSPMILAYGSVVSANLAWQMVNRGTPISSLAALIVGFVVLAMLYGLGPQLLFMPALMRLRRQARIAYGALAARHARLFEDRWFVPGETASELLGAPEISSLQDLATSYQLARGVRIVPFGQATVVSLLISALLPMLPLPLLEVPLKEILVRLLKILV